MHVKNHNTWVRGVLSYSMHNRSFWRRVFPSNQLHWYWQPNSKQKANHKTNNMALGKKTCKNAQITLNSKPKAAGRTTPVSGFSTLCQKWHTISKVVCTSKCLLLLSVNNRDIAMHGLGGLKPPKFLVSPQTEFSPLCNLHQNQVKCTWLAMVWF